MNFIYTLLAFIITAVIAFAMTLTTTNIDTYNIFIVVGGVFTIASLLTVFIMMFKNMNSRTMIRMEINSYEQSSRRISQKMADLERYKRELKETLIELYPNYEKDLFKGMNNNDAKQLEMIMVKYPELKFDGILNNYVNGIKSRLDSINRSEEKMTYCVKNISDYINDGWFLGKINLPQKFKNYEV